MKTLREQINSLRGVFNSAEKRSLPQKKEPKKGSTLSLNKKNDNKFSELIPEDGLRVHSNSGITPTVTNPIDRTSASSTQSVYTAKPDPNLRAQAEKKAKKLIAEQKQKKKRIRKRNNKRRRKGIGKSKVIFGRDEKFSLLEPSSGKLQTAKYLRTKTLQKLIPNIRIDENYLRDLKLADNYSKTQSAVVNWRDQGLATQAYSATPPLPAHREVTIGIDFGTSYSKVAVRIDDVIYYVNFYSGQESIEDFTIPSCLYIRRDNTCDIYNSEDVMKSYNGLKSNFLITSETPVIRAESCIYIALIMRFTRAWLYVNPTTGNLLRASNIIWKVNLGCPTGSVKVSGIIEKQLKKLAARAWVLSNKENLKLEDFNSHFDTDPRTLFAKYSINEIGVFPEFAAQVAGYLKSSELSEELHLICDVGAGTVDVSIFNIYDYNSIDHSEESEMRLPIFSSGVITRGTHVLMTNRLAHSGIGRFVWNDADVIPTPGYMVEEFDCKENKVRAVDEAVVVSVFDEIIRQINHVKNIVYPEARVWEKGHSMRLFFCGGGASSEVYQRVFTRLESRRVQSFDRRNIGMDLSTMSTSQRNMAAVHRLSVAAGLTQDLEDLKIKTPSQIPIYSSEKVLKKKVNRDEIYSD